MQKALTDDGFDNVHIEQGLKGAVEEGMERKVWLDCGGSPRLHLPPPFSVSCSPLLASWQ